MDRQSGKAGTSNVDRQSGDARQSGRIGMSYMEDNPANTTNENMEEKSVNLMNILEDATLDNSLAEIVEKLQSLMDSFWVYIVIALAAVVVIWGAYIGIRIAIAHRNDEKINARDMVKNLIIGIIIIFVVAMGAPLLIQGLSAWVS